MNNLLIYTPIFVLLMFLLILFLETHIVMEYEKEFTIKIKVLFIRFRIFPFPLKFFNIKKNKHYIKTSKKRESSHYRSKVDKILEAIKLLKKIIDPLTNTSKKILYHVNIEEIYINLGVNGGDAANTSIKYAHVQTIISNLLSRIVAIKNIKYLNINIYPNFINLENLLKFKIDISSRFIFILYELLIFSFKYVKMNDNAKL